MNKPLTATDADRLCVHDRATVIGPDDGNGRPKWCLHCGAMNAGGVWILPFGEIKRRRHA